MKKQALNVLSLASLWIVLAVVSASAQIFNLLKASTPFDFAFGNSPLLADTNTVKPVSRLDEWWIPKCCNVFARNNDGHLIFYGGLNQAENLSQRFPQGFEIAGLPRPVATVQANSGLGAHWAADVFGRSPSGELIHYRWNPRDDWQVENLTSGPNAAMPIAPLTSNPTFVGDPKVFSYYKDQGYVQRQDVFARNDIGQLIHYWRIPTPTGVWKSENLTVGSTAAKPIAPLTSNPTFVGDPDVVVSEQNSYLRHDVFARNNNGQLIHYWWSAQPPSGWHAENLTVGSTAAKPIAPLTANPTIVGNPEAVFSYQNGYLRHDIFARNNIGQLIHYWWSALPPSGWHAENLTVGSTAAKPIAPLTSNPTFVGDPDVVVSEQNDYLRHDVFVLNNNGHLIHYWWSAAPPSGWHAENLTVGSTAATPRPPFTSNPTIVGPLNAVASYQNGYLRHDVFARNISGPLIHYWWSAQPPSGWHAENLTHETSGPTLASALDVYITNNPYMHDSTYKHEVFARSDILYSGPGHLVRYHWSAVPPAVWDVESLTTTKSGPSIVGDPMVMKLQVSHPNMLWDQ